MRRVSMILMLGMLTSTFSGCLATRKFVRTEVKDSSDNLSGTLNARIDKTDAEVAEVKDGVKAVDGKVTAVDGKVGAVDNRVTQLDTKTNEQFVTVKNDVSAVDKKATTAQTNLVALDEKFQNRNQYSVASEKTILFRFDSAKLDSKYESDIEQIGTVLQKNPDAIVILEGRTDSRGDSEYNVKLGERRVDAVKRVLAVDLGVPVYKIHDVSYGAAKPVAENKSREGREKNRAVILTILVSKASATNNN